jgi:hypothetical protein
MTSTTIDGPFLKYIIQNWSLQFLEGHTDSICDLPSVTLFQQTVFVVQSYFHLFVKESLFEFRDSVTIVQLSDL